MWPGLLVSVTNARQPGPLTALPVQPGPLFWRRILAMMRRAAQIALPSTHRRCLQRPKEYRVKRIVLGLSLVALFAVMGCEVGVDTGPVGGGAACEAVLCGDALINGL